mgnify:CR=1 FL=1|jgi:hypothetical protein
MALKTDYKDAAWAGDRLYEIKDAGSGTSPAPSLMRQHTPRRAILLGRRILTKPTRSLTGSQKSRHG